MKNQEMLQRNTYDMLVLYYWKFEVDTIKRKQYSVAEWCPLAKFALFRSVYIAKSSQNSCSIHGKAEEILAPNRVRCTNDLCHVML